LSKHNGPLRLFHTPAAIATDYVKSFFFPDFFEQAGHSAGRTNPARNNLSTGVL
jgi:hypothetical protein